MIRLATIDRFLSGGFDHTDLLQGLRSSQHMLSTCFFPSIRDADQRNYEAKV